ncbi:MAG: dipeptidase PepE [Gemmatimonadota bacterium]|nr:dipeptidase PepE [Gemmatimonadota bacterium]
MRLLLLSNSTNFGGTFLGHAGDWLRAHLSGARNVLFVPFAAVRFSYDEFVRKVAEQFQPFGCVVQGIHAAPDPVAAVRACDAIAVGGGNTFRLLARLYEFGLLDPIRQRVQDGAPYVGWSAGSNVACPTIRTTNDMPVVEPPSFDALGLVPFQINPHFTDAAIPNHGGETRSERLLEFLELNPTMPVLSLREGTALLADDRGMQLLGNQPALGFVHGQTARELAPGPFAGF